MTHSWQRSGYDHQLVEKKDYEAINSIQDLFKVRKYFPSSITKNGTVESSNVLGAGGSYIKHDVPSDRHDYPTAYDEFSEVQQDLQRPQYRQTPFQTFPKLMTNNRENFFIPQTNLGEDQSSSFDMNGNELPLNGPVVQLAFQLANLATEEEQYSMPKYFVNQPTAFCFHADIEGNTLFHNKGEQRGHKSKNKKAPTKPGANMIEVMNKNCTAYEGLGKQSSKRAKNGKERVKGENFEEWEQSVFILNNKSARREKNIPSHKHHHGFVSCNKPKPGAFIEGLPRAYFLEESNSLPQLPFHHGSSKQAINFRKSGRLPLDITVPHHASEPRLIVKHPFPQHNFFHKSHSSSKGVARAKQIECVFCKTNGETPSTYRGHVLKDDLGQTVCHVLQQYTCPCCGATGKEAHTLKYCPQNNNPPALATMSTLKSMRLSTGKMRHEQGNRSNAGASQPGFKARK